MKGMNNGSGERVGLEERRATGVGVGGSEEEQQISR